jgi:aryl-alcohol dehydrogenase-like predicted oxidoreductase
MHVDIFFVYYMWSNDMSVVDQSKNGLFSGIPIGIGTWSWGDRLYWGFGHGYDKEDLRAVFQFALDAGISFFETSEIYGQGKAEVYLGEFLRETSWNGILASKFVSIPWRLRKKALSRALRNSLVRLEQDKIDLYQIHGSLSPVTIETWIDEMVEAVQQGLIEHIGVSDFNRDQLQRAYDHLVKEGVTLASCQHEYSLLNRSVEFSGLLSLCKQLNISFIACSPLAMGILTGKYTPQNPPSGFRGRKYSPKHLQIVQPLLKLLKKIGQTHDGKTPAQVAINWLICKGTVPVPGAKTLRQAEENVGAVGWYLDNEEVAALDELSSTIATEIE